MCGIAGFVDLDSKKPSADILRQMLTSIAYRGPDDEGLEIIDSCALGNRRLAIIDLSPKAHMPMWDQQKRFCLTYNGEIYNFRKLRKELEKKGHCFRSDSDTEVILNLYKEFGPDCVERLNGMFAFAIWDRQQRALFLARDHFGLKPLHFFLNDQVFVFGSEIKAILCHPQVKREINPVALSYYFSLGFGCIASPETIFKKIYKILPGHWLLLRGKHLKTKEYWDLAKIKPIKVSFPEAVSETRRLLEQAVKRQLVADVPLGTFLSGGIDSSLITAFAKKHSRLPVKTFSIGFEDKNFDESQYAQQVAVSLKTDHHHQNFTSRELLATLPKVMEKLDEPLADTSIFPCYLLAAFTRKKVKVALSGDGGDELFAGYPTYLAHKFAGWFHLLPKPAIKVLGKTSLSLGGALSGLPVFRHSPNLPAAFKLSRFFAGLDKDLVIQHLNFLGPMNLKEKQKLLINHRESALPFIQALAARISQRDPQTQLQYLDFLIYLSEDCLVKADRASSFNSLETRVPFLDLDLVEFVFALPADYHLRGLTLKFLLKKVAEDLIPPNIINRPKKGFGLPVHQWLRGELKSVAGSLLEKKRLKRQGLFRPDFVARAVEEHQQGRVDHRMLLWSLFIFQLWYERWR